MGRECVGVCQHFVGKAELDSRYSLCCGAFPRIRTSRKGAAVSSKHVGASEDGYGEKAYQRTDSGQYVDIYDKL